jgi:hypothetical protein
MEGVDREEGCVEMSLVTLFIIFAAVVGSGSMVAVFAYALSRFRRIESGYAGSGGSDLLVEQVSRIREELLTVQEEMSALTERLDFTEKLLMSGDDADPVDGSGDSDHTDHTE